MANFLIGSFLEGKRIPSIQSAVFYLWYLLINYLRQKLEELELTFAFFLKSSTDIVNLSVLASGNFDARSTGITLILGALFYPSRFKDTDGLFCKLI